MTDDEPHLSQDDARAGATPHMTRVILAASMILIIGIFAALYFFWSQ